MLEQPVPEGLHPVEGTHAGAVCEELQDTGRTDVGEVCGELWRTVFGERDLTLEQGKSVRSPPPEGQGLAETTCDELNITPIPVPLHCSGEGGRATGVKLSPGRKQGLRGRCLKI